LLDVLCCLAYLVINVKQVLNAMKFLGRKRKITARRWR